MDTEGTIDRFRGCLVGLAVGDALGAPVEGLPAAEISERYGWLDQLVGGGWLGLRPGEWTDDTAMMLCIARSIVARGGFDPGDVAARFLAWFQEGPRGIGRTTWLALDALKGGATWREAGKWAHYVLGGLSAGNGSIMRCAPVALLSCRDQARLIAQSIESSLITHWDPQACWGAAALNLAIARLLLGEEGPLIEAVRPLVEEPRVAAALAQVPAMTMADIEPSAYCLDTLKAALWCFLTSSSFEGAVTAAVNLGGDADTTGAVCGALAGAAYGLGAIPQRWQAPLVARDEMVALADDIYRLAFAGPTS